MNEVDAKSRPAPGGGYYGLLRKVHRADYEPVQANGVPIIFRTAHEAEIAAWRALKAHLCGDLLRDGETISAAKDRAEGFFKKGRFVEVVRR